MAVVTGPVYAVGTRYVNIFALNANGRPLATAPAHTAYTGVEISGPKAFTLGIPEPRRITHTGNDRVLASDFLPPLEPITAEISVSPAANFALDAILTVVKSQTIGESTVMGRGTDQQGNEPQVGLLFYQQAIDAATKVRRWRWWIIPSARIIPIMSGAADNTVDTRYTVAINPATSQLWGTALSVATNGCLEAGVIEGVSANKPRVVAWLGDNSEKDFNLPTAYPALASATPTAAVFLNGALQTITTEYTITTTVLSMVSTPASGADLVMFYETA